MPHLQGIFRAKVYNLQRVRQHIYQGSQGLGYKPPAPNHSLQGVLQHHHQEG